MFAGMCVDRWRFPRALGGFTDCSVTAKYVDVVDVVTLWECQYPDHQLGTLLCCLHSVLSLSHYYQRTEPRPWSSFGPIISLHRGRINQSRVCRRRSGGSPRLRCWTIPSKRHSVTGGAQLNIPDLQTSHSAPALSINHSYFVHLQNIIQKCSLKK